MASIDDVVAACAALSPETTERWALGNFREAARILAAPEGVTPSMITQVAGRLDTFARDTGDDKLKALARQAITHLKQILESRDE